MPLYIIQEEYTNLILSKEDKDNIIFPGKERGFDVEIKVSKNKTIINIEINNFTITNLYLHGGEVEEIISKYK